MPKYSILIEGVVVLVAMAVSAVAFYTAGKNAVLEDIKNQREATIQCDDRSGFRIIKVNHGEFLIKCGDSV